MADSLNNDHVEIFTWVRNNIDYEPYYGSLKSSEETLRDMAGNDCDQSSLLIALLRASGIHARYVRGDVELKIEDLMNWTGGKTPEAAVSIMQSNWIPTQTLYKQEAIEGVIFDHIWVEIFDGHNWRLADPSYKEYVYTEGTEITPEQETALVNLIEGAITISEDEKRFSANQDIVNFAMEEAAKMMEGMVISGRKILINDKNNLPPYLARGIIGDRKPAEEFSEMPDDMRFKIKLEIFGSSTSTETLLMTETTGKRLSVAYKKYMAGTIEAYQPLIQLDGQTIISSTTGYRLGRRHSIAVSLLRPGYDLWETYNKSLHAGEQANICITTQKTSAEFLKEKTEALQSILDASGLSSEDMMTEDMISKSLELDSLVYFVLMDYIRGIISNQMGIVNVNHVSLAFVVDELIVRSWFGIIFSVTKGGVHIDIPRSANNPVSATGNIEDQVKCMQIYGGFSTNMEHAMLEIMYDIEAVSTGKIFAEANKVGIPVHVIKPETLEADLAQISANSTVKNHIRSYLTHETRVFEAFIPQQAITLGSWSGQGWIVSEPSTGAAGYMICGGLHNNEILAGGSLIEKLNNIISELAHLLAMVHGVAEAFILGTISLALAHFVGAMILLAETTIITSLFGIWFAVIGACLTIVSLAILIQLLKNAMHHARYIIPHRKNKLILAFA